jgi:DNA repair protein RecO (recombination protein O)
VNRLQTKGIILSRTDFGEADRIITVLTPEQGKLRLMAKGVRKPKSKLAGGIELFSVSDLTFIRGKGEIGTLISSRLDKHYGKIVRDMGRVQLGYDLIKSLNKATEDEPEKEYFDTLQDALAALDDQTISETLVRAWFDAQLIRLAGHSPNLRTDTENDKLETDKTYDFDIGQMAFAPRQKGRYSAGHIKALRLLFSGHQPGELARVQGLPELLDTLQPLVQAMRHS